MWEEIMNWEIPLAAVIVAVSIFSATGNLRRMQLAILCEGRRNTIANMAALFLAAKLADKEYVDRIEKLRSTRKQLEFYPGEERMKEIEAEMEIAETMLREIDYKEERVRREWIELASQMYRESPDCSE
jgi:hypothetical protein